MNVPAVIEPEMPTGYSTGYVVGCDLGQARDYSVLIVRSASRWSGGRRN